MTEFFYVFVFIIGLIAGSFLNCLIYRLEKNKSFVKGRSFCPKCKHILKWYDLLPVLSFTLLKGKCRYCKKKISLQYPLIETATGIIFLLIFNFQWFGYAHHPELAEGFSIFKQFSINQFFNFQTIAQLFYLWFIGACLIVVFVYDLKTFFIPDKIIYPAVGLVLFYSFFEVLNFDIGNLFGIWNLEFGIFKPLFIQLLAGLAASLFFFSIWALSRGKWLGFGDVKLAFLMGLFLGWPNILPALFFAFLIGAIIGVMLIALKKKKVKSEVPFGPFLVLGAFIALFWGSEIITWYLGFLV